MSRRWLFALSAVVVLALLVAGVWLVMGMGKAGVEKKAPKITSLRSVVVYLGPTVHL